MSHEPESEPQLRAVYEAMACGIVVQDGMGRVTYANKAAQEVLGLTREQIYDRTPRDPRRRITHEDGAPCPDDEHPAALARRTRQAQRHVVLGLHSTSGERRWVQVDAVPVLDDAGGVVQVVSSFIDITACKQAEEALLVSEARLQAVISAAPVVITAVDTEGIVTFSSGRGLEAIGRTPGETVGLAIWQVLRDAPDALDHVRRALDGEQCRATINMRNVAFETHYAPLRDAHGEIVGAVGVSTDVTERARAERALRASETHFRTLIERAPIAACVMAEDATLELVNDAYCTLTGYTRAELIGRHVTLVMPPEEHGEFARRFSAAPEGTVEHQFRTAAGDLRHGLVSRVRLAGPDGHPRLVAFVLDLTERKRLEEHLERLAHRDALTGLPNRVLFADRLDHALQAAGRAGRPLALLLIDLDRFKEVNDTLGHDTGDALLCALAGRMSETLRASDTVARLGGDEFAVLLPDAGEEGALSAAYKLAAAFSAPVALAGRQIEVGGSIGVALCPDHAVDATTLLRHADVAMYAAKRGGDGVAVYAAERDTASGERLALSGELRAAIASGQMALHYQPVVDLATGAVLAMEALARWRHPTRGLLAPERFIPLAEETGAILPLTAWSLDAALACCATWPDPALGVAVNLSARALRDDGLPALVADVLRRHGVSPRRLTLEVTETAMMREPEHSIAILRSLKELGVRLAIDDFGTGYSSLALLSELPLDELKIDRSFLRRVGGGTQDASIIAFMVSLARSCALHVVAEGVETPTMRALLSALGCDAAQGYLFSRPLPPDDLAAWLAARHTIAVTAAASDRPAERASASHS